MKRALFTLLLLAVAITAGAGRRLLLNSGSVAAPAALAPHWADGLSVGNFDASVNWQEISGMATPQVAANAGYIWIISDAPANMLACVSAANASVQGVYTLATPPAYSDWEDIASGTVGGQAFIYVADFGDNGSVRATITIFRIKEPTITGAGGVIAAVDYEAIVCAYPGVNAPVSKDAETLLVDPDTGDMYVILKRDAVQKIYKLPYAASYTGTQTLGYEGAMTSLPSVTTVALTTTPCYAVSGTISPNGQEILIRNYNDVYYFPRNKATQTIMQALQQGLVIVPAFVGGGSVSPKKSHPNGEPQGEAICYSPDGLHLYTSSEYVATEGSTAARYPLFKYTRASAAPTTVSFQDGVSPTAGYAGTLDTYIWGTTPGTTRGAEVTMVLDITAGNPTDERKALVKWDLSSIPATATVIGAKMEWWIAAEGQGWVWYRVLQTWDETSTYTSLGGAGANGGVTNNGTFASTTESVRNGVNLDTILSVIARDNVLVSDVQTMVADPSQNFGWFGRNTDAATGDGVQFDSRESITAARRPKLTVRFIP